MNLKALSDETLLSKTDELVRGERELLSEILHHLREIERRRLYSQLGYKSLFDYATKKLGYADDQAARRISAMRLLKELPEIEEKITNGALTLTNLSMAQTLFRQEQKRSANSDAGFTKDLKLEVLAELENKSKREAEKILVARSSEPVTLKPDRVRAVSDQVIEIRFMADCDLQLKLERIKGLLAHSQPDMNLAETIGLLCDMAIEKLDPAKKPSREARSASASIDYSSQPQTTGASSAPALKRRITARARRLVWRKANSRCEICGTVRALQVDHIHPKALGGPDTPENLRLLCRPCNQREAINKLGLPKMQRFLDRPLS